MPQTDAVENCARPRASDTGVSLRKISKSFGQTMVIEHVDLDISDGEFIVIVGPSGCGKSTLLRMVAGLETVTDGKIFICGNDVTRLPPAQRQVAMVFQSYALYPHLTVARNLGYSLNIAGKSKAEISQRVELVAKKLHLSPLLERRPGQLSGGQRQRVAIGRAIVREPQLFLFDEPLSNLDAELRVEMRVELSRLHRELGKTMVYVTHDQVEAMTMAERIVVVNNGKIEQVGSPQDLYEAPENTFVARFIGSPAMNFLKAKYMGDGAAEIEGEICNLPDLNGKLQGGDEFEIGIRPEHLAVGDADGIRIAMVVTETEYLGSVQLLYGASKFRTRLTVETRDAIVPDLGQTIALTALQDQLHFFDREGRRIN